jgi:hypothetical protein
MSQIKYRSGYKYQLAEQYRQFIGIDAGPIESEFISVSDGMLVIKSGYAWDGPSGPVIDTKNLMRGSLVHDALYQLIREGHLTEDYKEFADRQLQQICREDGMSRLQALLVYQAVKRFGGVDIEDCRKILTAP